VRSSPRLDEHTWWLGGGGAILARMDVEVAALTGSALVGLPHHLDEDKVSTYAQILGQLPPVVGTGKAHPTLIAPDAA
jgi:hypothetical protein